MSLTTEERTILPSVVLNSCSKLSLTGISPYFDCRANYNERNGWLIDSENSLHNFCDKLDKQGIKFAMSNVANIAGQENKQLLDWVRINNYSITEFTDCINYTACSNEVLITNY